MLTIIIPTYNKLNRLKIALEALKYQVCDKDSWSVLVIDDCSTDGTDLFLENACYPYRLNYIISKNQGGRSKARNIGIVNAKSRFVFLMDDDIILDEHYLTHVLDQLNTNGVEAIRGSIYELYQFGNINNITARELSKNPEIYDICLNDFLNKGNNKKRVHSIKTHLEKITAEALDNNSCNYQWLGLTGSGFACRRDLLLNLGGFDEQMGVVWGCEDFELGYRFVQKYRIKYSNDCIAYHMSHKRENYENSLKISFEYFYKKHNDLDIWKMYEMISNRDWSNKL